MEIRQQKGYVVIVLVIFAVLVGLMIFPMKFPTSSVTESEKCIAGEPPAEEHIVKLPMPTFEDAKYYPDTEEYIYSGPPDQSKIEEYILIRQNVLAPKEATTRNWLIFGTNPLTGLAHSIPQGENPQKPGYGLYYPTSPGEFYYSDGSSRHLRNEELVLFRNEDPASVKDIDGKTYYTVDVYQTRRKFEDPNKGYVTEDLFNCVGEPLEARSTTIVVPSQDLARPNDQLQLEWFLFQRKGGGLWGIHCKPAIYLYPPEKRLINVKVYPKGQLSYTEPFYDPLKGWTVEANPTGALFSLNREPIPSNYLYYESKILDSEIKKPNKGWSVKSEDMEGLFNEVLPKLGLNRKEKQDFMDYWLAKLPESPYYFVGLIEKPQRDYLEALEVNPKPDTSIRFSFYFQPSDRSVSVTEPRIQTPERSGFTLVDWGGMIKLHPGTPFTCSQ